MRTARVSCWLALCIGLACLCTAEADLPLVANCTVVQCFVNPCTTTTCKPVNPDWKCKPNYCGGCKTNWRHKKTGLQIAKCPPDVCPLIFAPVCGKNGKTYANACVALFNGVKVAYQGPCKPKCPKIKVPVCGKDGVTYRNKCLAIEKGTTVAYNGTCFFPTLCAKFSKKYKPVCDNVTKLTWTNICVAKLNNAPTTPGPCIGPICAKCTEDSGCNAPHRCKGNKKYTCEIAGCQIQHILDSGKRVTYSVCSPIYKNKSTGYPAAACYP